MIKVLLVLIGLLVPFFSHSFSESIFTDENTSIPKTLLGTIFTCGYYNRPISELTVERIGMSNYELTGYCVSIVASALEIDDRYTDCQTPTATPVDTGSSYYIDFEWIYSSSGVKCDYHGSSTVNVIASNVVESELTTCPPHGVNYQSWIYEVYGDSDGDGIATLERCADPSLIPLFDTCDYNDSPNVQVTESNACYTKLDGSSCAVTAVDVGGGNQIYMGSEGDCYDGSRPDITTNPDLGGIPVGQDCVPSGALLACPEDPTNVCGDSGTTYGDASVNNCQAGCGYVNDSFVCYDTDIDGDGLPDYNDPDIDGDGIANKDDLDSDGDGKDDPINSVNSGSGTSSTDLTPVVNELKKLNDQFKATEVKDFDSDKKLEKLNTDYNTELTAFLGKSSDELGYKDSLSLVNSSGLTASLPSEQCQNYVIPVGYFGNFTLDTCALSSKVQPLLTWFFGLLTAWYIFFTINRTLSEGF